MSKFIDPGLLHAVSRATQRRRLAIDPADPPFRGADLWTAYEVSWLNPKGKPEVAIAHLDFPCQSAYLIESKSLKLYLGSLDSTRFGTPETVRDTIASDLSARVEYAVSVRLESLAQAAQRGVGEFSGTCLDDLEVTVTDYRVNREHLVANRSEIVREAVYSHLLKSNCPVTHQPDWGSVLVRYAGPRIAREGLLRYIVSFREHEGFHEHCVERMFVDIMERCQPRSLMVYARYLRRGGLDINPYRSTAGESPGRSRLARQ